MKLSIMGSKLLGEPWAYGKFTNTSFGYELKHRFNKDWTFRSSACQYFTHEDRLYFQMKTPQKIVQSLDVWHIGMQNQLFKSD